MGCRGSRRRSDSSMGTAYRTGSNSTCHSASSAQSFRNIQKMPPYYKAAEPQWQDVTAERPRSSRSCPHADPKIDEFALTISGRLCKEGCQRRKPRQCREQPVQCRRQSVQWRQETTQCRQESPPCRQVQRDCTRTVRRCQPETCNKYMKLLIPYREEADVLTDEEEVVDAVSCDSYE